MPKDPKTFWYREELAFFDDFVIPLAQKLKECAVFGDDVDGSSGDEFLNYALNNRREWKSKGRELIDNYVWSYHKREEMNEMKMKTLEQQQMERRSSAGSGYQL